MTDPTAVVLAHIEVVIVVDLEAGIAEFTVATVKRFLRQL